MQDESVGRLFKEQLNHYSQKEQAKDSHIIDLVSQWIEKKKYKRKIRICEFGGGAGQLLNEIGNSYSNTELTNVEIVGDYKRFIVSKQIRFVVSSVLDSKLSDNSFDVILMRNVMHHLIGKNLKETRTNQTHALKELKRLVSSNGAIFIEELTNPSEVACTLLYFLTKLNSKLKLRFFSFYINPNAIIYFFTPNRLLNLYIKIFGKRNILASRIDRVKTNLERRVLHLGRETYMVTSVLKKA